MAMHGNKDNIYTWYLAVAWVSSGCGEDEVGKRYLTFQFHLHFKQAR